MQWFRVDLKTVLGLATPKLSESKYQASFGVIILGQNPQTFMNPIYIVLPYYMITKRKGVI